MFVVKRADELASERIARDFNGRRVRRKPRRTAIAIRDVAGI
jgi:hypothetical protein